MKIRNKKTGEIKEVSEFELNQYGLGSNIYKLGGQHGGLDRWFAEKWVDIKTGKTCGRKEGENRNYPACRPSKRISSATPKTASELSASEKEKFKREKTSSQRISYNHNRKQYGGENINNINYMKYGGNMPTNPELWSKAKATAKSKYDVYPSAYANGFAAKWYKSHGGGWKKAQYGMDVYENTEENFPTYGEGVGQIPMAQDGVIVKKYIQQTPYPNYIPEGNIYQMPVMDNLIYEKPVYTKPIIIKNNKSSDKPQVTNNSDNYTKASKYLSRDVLKGATLKASDIANAIEKFKKKTGYDYPLDLLLTQAQQETHFGRELKSEHNYFNVGNDDDGNVINFASPEESLLNYMDLVYNDYLQKGKKDYHDLLVDKAYVNYAGKRYASDPLYEKKLRDQSQFINRFLNKKKKGGQYMAIGGQNMMNPVVKKDNRNWLEYLKN